MQYNTIIYRPCRRRASRGAPPRTSWPSQPTSPPPPVFSRHVVSFFGVLSPCGQFSELPEIGEHRTSPWEPRASGARLDQDGQLLWDFVEIRIRNILQVWEFVEIRITLNPKDGQMLWEFVEIRIWDFVEIRIRNNNPYISGAVRT